MMRAAWLTLWLAAVAAAAGDLTMADEEWPAASPDETMDPALSERIDSGVADGQLDGLHGVVVIRDGRLALERYYAGEDERWGQDLGRIAHDANRLHDLRSVSKSVVALLYGVARDRGLAPPPVAPLLDQFPEIADLPQAEAKRALTVEHALTMSLGLAWNEDLPYTDPRNSEIAMEMAPDRCRYVLEQTLIEPPGARWRYSGGATALIARILAGAVGQPLDRFAEEALFAPLGIEKFEWIGRASDDPAAASGLRLRPRDLAKIGQLVLDGGVWRGRRIVSAEWIEAMLTPRIEIDEHLSYGYQWWLDAAANGRRWIGAFGNGGQRLWIGLTSRTVVVVAAGRYNQLDAWKLPVSVIVEHVLPAIRPMGGPK